MSLLLSYHPSGTNLVRKGRGNADPGPPPAAERFPGDPKVLGPTKLLLGEARGLNESVTFRETASGQPLPVRRRFYSQLTQIAVPNGQLLQAVREDHAAGRLPWVSFKVPSWSTAKDGGYDLQWDALIAELESYAKPTWLTFNHEPENDGASFTSADWRAMQQRFRARMDAFGTIRRIAFSSVLMGWTWDTRSGRNPLDWHAAEGTHDFIGIDHYAEPPTQTLLDANPWTTIENFMAARNLPFALGELGLRYTDSRQAAQFESFYNRMTNGTLDCAAIAWFDSSQNSPPEEGHFLNADGETMMYQLLADADTVRLSDLGY